MFTDGSAVAGVEAVAVRACQGLVCEHEAKHVPRVEFKGVGRFLRGFENHVRVVAQSGPKVALHIVAYVCGGHVKGFLRFIQSLISWTMMAPQIPQAHHVKMVWIVSIMRKFHFRRAFARRR